MPDIVDQLGDGVTLSLAQSASRFTGLNDQLLQQIGSYGDIGSALKSTNAIADVLCGKDDNVLQQYFSGLEREMLDSMISMEYWINVENILDQTLENSAGFTLQDGKRFIEAFNESAKSGLDSFNALFDGDLTGASDNLATLGGSLQEASRVLAGIPGMEGVAERLDEISGIITLTSTSIKDIQTLKNTVENCDPKPPKLPTFDTVKEKFDTDLQRISDVPIDLADGQNKLLTMTNSELKEYKTKLSQALSNLSSDNQTT